MKTTTLKRVFLIFVITLITLAIPCMTFAKYTTGKTSSGSAYKQNTNTKRAASQTSASKRIARNKMMTITGTILNVNAARHQVQVRATNGKTYVVRVPSSMRIMSNGKKQTISDLKPGMEVKVSGSIIRTNTLTARSLSESKRVSMPSSTGSANETSRKTATRTKLNTITGTITNVMSSRNEIEVRSAKGKTYIVKVPASTQIMSKGNKIKISDLKKGTEIRVTGQMTGTDRITAKNMNEISGLSNTGETKTRSDNERNEKTPSEK